MKQKDKTDVSLKIILNVDQGDLKKTSPGLGALLNIYVDTLPNIIMGLWHYIKVVAVD